MARLDRVKAAPENPHHEPSRHLSKELTKMKHLEESFQLIVERKMNEPAALGDLPPDIAAEMFKNPDQPIRYTRKHVIAERLVRAAENGKPWAMQVLLDRVYPRVNEVEINVRSWVDIITEKELMLRAALASGITLSQLPQVIDVMALPARAPRSLDARERAGAHARAMDRLADILA